MRTSMSEVHADYERAVQLVDHLPPEEYWEKVGKHLDLIAAGAEMAARHARMMDRKPAFATAARSDLEATEATLTRALETVRAAKVAYDAKPQECR